MSLDALIDRLASFDPVGFPVVSLYLNTQPDEHGRERPAPFVRKELGERVRTYPARSAERESLERDRDRIEAYVRESIRPSANGVALFACDAADLFEAVQLDAPIEESQAIVADQPHLYPLARLHDQYPRYAALLVNTNSARLLVFGTGSRLAERTVANEKTNRTAMGGWSQARYQRHVDNVHLQHAKEVVDVLDGVVRREGIERVVLAGDEVIVPLLRDQLPPALADRVVDVLRLDIRTPESEVLERSLESLRERDAKDDRDAVARLLGEYRAGGLAVVGPEATRAALEIGQVDELLITAVPATIAVEAEGEGEPADREAVAAAEAGGAGAVASAATPFTAPEGAPPEEAARVVADELVTRARRTSAGVRFIEDPDLLSEFGGVGAFLRYRVAGPGDGEEGGRRGEGT
jgi:peptide subunit release factor 1 (eRF1)